MNELETRNLLKIMAADPAPPTTVDVDRAIADAKRKKLTTRWGVLATAAAAVLIVTVGLAVIIKPDEPDRTPLAAAPAYFDPLHPRLQVGWWPEGFTDDGLWNAAITAEFVTSGVKNGGKSATVYALPKKGGFPAVELYGDPVETAEINGRPSTWHQLATRDEGPPFVAIGPDGKPSPSPTAKPKPKTAQKNAGILRWYYADGGQAQVEIYGFQNAKEIAYKIATSVSLDEPRNFRMAAEFSRPKTIPVVRTGGTSEGTMVEFASAGWRAPSMTVGVGQVRYVQKPNYKLNGQPVRRDLIDSSALFQVPFGAGQELDVQCSAKDNTQAAKIANNEECERVTASAKPVGKLSDPATWSDNPVR